MQGVFRTILIAQGYLPFRQLVLAQRKAYINGTDSLIDVGFLFMHNNFC